MCARLTSLLFDVPHMLDVAIGRESLAQDAFLYPPYHVSECRCTIGYFYCVDTCTGTHLNRLPANHEQPAPCGFVLLHCSDCNLYRFPTSRFIPSRRQHAHTRDGNALCRPGTRLSRAAPGKGAAAWEPLRPRIVRLQGCE